MAGYSGVPSAAMVVMPGVVPDSPMASTSAIRSPSFAQPAVKASCHFCGSTSANWSVAVSIDGVALRELRNQFERAVRLPENANLHSGRADIHPKYCSHESLRSDVMNYFFPFTRKYRHGVSRNPGSALALSIRLQLAAAARPSLRLRQCVLVFERA